MLANMLSGESPLPGLCTATFSVSAHGPSFVHMGWEEGESDSLLHLTLRLYSHSPVCFRPHL